MDNQTINEVVIIYNPVSTGAGKRMSLKLKRQLKKKMPDLPVRVIPTKYAMHAIELAEMHGGANILLLAASGDGGYNELINGAMKIQLKTGIMPICGVIPAGHANDHYRALSNKENTLINNIYNNRTRRVDLLKARYTDENGVRVERFAHSYIGLGLSSFVVKDLNSKDLNHINDKIIAAISLSKYRPIKIRRRGNEKQIDSLIFTNTGRMGKWFMIAENSRLDDGLFEIQLTGYKSPAYRLKQLLKMAQAKPPKSKQVSAYSFEVCEDTFMQLDGEVVTVAGETEVNITILPKALPTIL